MSNTIVLFEDGNTRLQIDNQYVYASNLYVNGSLYIGNSTVFAVINSTSGLTNSTFNIDVSNAYIQANFTNNSVLATTLSNYVLKVNGISQDLHVTGNLTVDGTFLYTNTVANNALYLGGLLANAYQLHANLATDISGLSVNSAAFIGTTPAASVVNTSQLTGLQTTAGLAANVLTLSANNSSFLGGNPPGFYANVTTPYISTSINVGSNVIINSSGMFIGNSTVHTTVNSSFFQGTVNNALNLNGFPSTSFANVTNPVISSNLTIGNVGNSVTMNTTTIFIGNSSTYASINSTALIVNSAPFVGGGGGSVDGGGF